MSWLVIILVAVLVSWAESAYNYDYYGGNDNGGGYYSSSAFSESSALEISPCEDSVVQVTYAQVSCDSPSTFYYGNGANRNSPVCDYGDKATFTVEYSIDDDIDQVNDFYMTMAVYDSIGNVLASTQPQFLCARYVGSDCRAAGSYSFTAKVKFAVYDYNVTNFRPELRMAFSTAADHGYNLGAVNTECPQWEDPSQAFVEWNKHTQPSFIKVYFTEYGLFAFAAIGIALLMLFLRGQAGEYTPKSLIRDEAGRKMCLVID